MNIRTLPLIRLLVVFVAGIVTADSFPVTMNQYKLIGVSLLIIALILTIFNWLRTWYPSRWIIGFIVMPAVFSAGLLITLRYQTVRMTDPLASLPQPQSWIAEITALPDHRANSIRVKANLLSVATSDGMQPVSTGLLLYLPVNTGKVPQVGDLIAGVSRLVPVPGPLNPGAFNYKEYLARKGVLRQGWMPAQSFIILDTQAPRTIVYYSELIRSRLLNIISRKLSDQKVNAVASAILLGYDELLDPELRRTYSGTGAMHVLCVSGLHVGIFYALFAALLFPLSRNRRGETIKTIILLLLIWGYASVTGLSASVARSATMFTFVAIGKGFQRRTSVLNSLLASAFFLLSLNPYLLFEAGFQLSYAAVTGIVTFQPVLAQWWPARNKIIVYIRDLLTVSVAAQMFTVPIIIAGFHQFPNYFILSNIVVIPLSFLILVSGMATLAFSWVPIAGDLFSWLLGHFIWMMNGGVTIIEKLPGAVTYIPVFGPADTWLLFLAVTGLLFWLVMKYKPGLIITLFALLLLTISIQIQRFNYSKQKTLIIADGGRHVLAGTIEGRKALWIGSSATAPLFSLNGLNQHYAIGNGNWLYESLPQQSETENGHFKMLGGKRLVIIDSTFRVPKTESRLKADLVIVGQRPRIQPEWVVHRIEGASWVLCGSLSEYRRRQWDKACTKSNARVHRIDSLGALEISLR